MIEQYLNNINLLPKVSGVYSIVNVLNGNRYIGSSMNIHQRLASHRSKLRTGKHNNIHLLNAYNKYGEDKFKVQILETCSSVRDTLMFLEQKYLDLKPEYNISPFANRPDHSGKKCTEQNKQRLRQNRLGKKLSEETKRKISAAGMYKTTKKIYVYNLNGDYLAEFDGVRKAMEYLGINENGSSIYCAIGEHSKNSKSRYAYGYLWSKVKYDKIDPYFGKKASRSRNVDQLTLDGQFINKHNSSAEAAESFGYRNGRFWIKDCILGKRQEAFGFKWRYSNDK